MRRSLSWVVILIAATGLGAKGLIGPDLTKLMAQAGNNDLIPVNIILTEQANTDALEARCANLDKEARWELVVNELKGLSARTQAGLLAELRTHEGQGKASDIQPLWIINGIHCHATRAVIGEIVNHNEVSYAEFSLVYSPNLLPITPATKEKMLKGNITVPTDALEWNVRKVGADSVWRYLGYTGNGIIVGHIDTGINYNHVDFTGHLWSDPNYPHNGWNFESGNGDPTDINGHGTHTAGTVASNGAAGDTCGMAPRSQVMTCRVRTTADSLAEEQCFAAMQFCVAPPLSPQHHAHAITMSLGWQLSWNPRQATWRQCVTNVSTAGLPFLIAAGNERSISPPNSLRCPGNVPGPWKHPAEANGGRGGCISIAATTSADGIASFSSQGPVTWQSVAPYNDYPYPPGLIHPDVGAPGDGITSCAYNNNTGYLSGWSGTSMATPCVAGAVALMLERNPNLLPWQVDSILQMTVRPLGAQPKNNDFGTGRISAYQAVLATPLPNGVRLLKRTIDDAAGGNGDGIVNPGETVNFPTWVINMDATPHSGVTARIAKRDTSSLFTITDSLKTIGTIPAHDSASTGSDGFKIAVAPGAANGNVLKIDLICKDATDSIWTSSFDVTVGTAVLNYAGLIVRDSPPGGNGNSILDPGESATLIVQVSNTGNGNGYTVRGVLKSADARLNVTDTAGTYGTIKHDSTGRNDADRFAVTADAGIVPGTAISCTVRLYADGGYFAARPFTIRIGLPATPGAVLATLDTGYCKLTVSAFGALGYDAPAKDAGEGFCYPKTLASGLYYGGMLCGNSASYMVDHYYGVPASSIQSDWAISDSLRFYPPIPSADEMVIGSYTDAGHSSACGLKTTQTAYQSANPGYDDFVVLVFDYENAGSSAITGLYSGIICDFDIGSSTADDANTNTGRRASYIRQTSTPNPTMGIKLLAPTTAANLSVIDHDVYVYPTDTAMNEGMKYRFLNGQLHFASSNRSYDWSVVTSAGSFDLTPGARQRVAYAIVGGSDENNFLVNCDSAQSWYDRNVGIAEPPAFGPPRSTFRVAVAPNPFTRAARISYSLPRPGRLTIKAYDVSGREQAVLIDQPMTAGSGTLNWVPNEIAKGVYFIHADIGDQTIVQKVMIVR